MPLVTLADLQNESTDSIAAHLHWASELKQLYDDFLEKDDDNVSFNVTWGSAANRSGGIHASEISGCQRKVVYSLQETERQGTISAFWKRKFHTGHLVHALIQNDFKRMCEKSNGLYSFEEEVRISPKLQPVAAKYDINSSCDGIFVFHDGPYGPPIIRVAVEIKSMSANEWPDLKEPKPEHKEQSALYMKVLNVPVMWTMYYNKGTSLIVSSEHPWLFTFDHHLWETMEHRIIARHEDAREGRLPERTEGMLCEFCPYAHVCQPEYLQRKDRIEAAKQARAKARPRNPHKRSIRAPLKVMK